MSFPVPQYGQAMNYPTAPSPEADNLSSDQTSPPPYPASAYVQSPVHLRDKASPPPYLTAGHGEPSAHPPDQIGPPPYPASGYGEPFVRLTVSGAFDRDSGKRPVSSASSNRSSAHWYDPSAERVTVPGAFERPAEPASVYTRTSVAEQPSRTRLISNFSEPPATPGISHSSFFSDKTIRRGFIRKVYLILTTQLLVTLGFIALFVFVTPVKRWIQTDGWWCYMVAYGIFMVTYFVMVCVPSVRRNSPGNFICLFVFTIAFSYLAGTISSFHDTNIVLLAVGITGAVCFAITLFAIQTKIDFTMCSGLIFALGMVFFFFGIACLITYSLWGFSQILNTVYAGLGALVFSLFLVYDTQMIVGGWKHELSPEEYIFGALQLYLDVVYIFLFLLSIMGKKN